MTEFVFLVCTERSGSNLLTNMMGAHSQVCGPSPTHLFRLFANNISNYGDLSVDRNWAALIQDMVLNLDCKMGQWNTSLTTADLHDKTSKRSVGELLRIIYEKEAAFSGAKTIFVKENQSYAFIDFLEVYFPGSKFVYMVRDPRDVASSWSRNDSHPGGVEAAVNTWIRDQVGVKKLYGIFKADKRLVAIRYEDLIAEPAAVSERIMQFLGHSYEDSMITSHIDPTNKLNAARIKAWSNLDKPIITNNSGKFRDHLSDHDKRYIELRCHELMTEYGYECDLLKAKPDRGKAEQLANSLRGFLTVGNVGIASIAEGQIRRRRQAAIDRVLTRRM